MTVSEFPSRNPTEALQDEVAPNWVLQHWEDSQWITIPYYRRWVPGAKDPGGPKEKAIERLRNHCDWDHALSLRDGRDSPIYRIYNVVTGHDVMGAVFWHPDPSDSKN